LTTMDAESLYSCGFLGFSRFAAAWLSEADFRRLLPVCCPERDLSSSAARYDDTGRSQVRPLFREAHQERAFALRCRSAMTGS
jgi:hypothetical protein